MNGLTRYQESLLFMTLCQKKKLEIIRPERRAIYFLVSQAKFCRKDVETGYSCCYLKKSWRLKFSTPFLNGIFFFPVLKVTSFSPAENTAVSQKQGKRKLITIKPRGIREVVIRLFDAFPLFNWELPLGLTCRVRRVWGRRLGRRRETGRWGGANRKGRKGNFTEEKAFQLGLIQETREGQQRGFNTILSIHLSLSLSLLCSVLTTFSSHSLPSCSAPPHPLNHLKQQMFQIRN